MQKRFYNKEPINKLIVVNKPIYISSNSYLNRIKRKYKNKKAGFSGTLDPFACGCLIVAFGQYAKLFNYMSKTPKKYRATVWLGVESNSFDIENIASIENSKRVEVSIIKEGLAKLKGKHEYYPPKFSAKRINGKRAYELARQDVDFKMKKSTMDVSKVEFISYNHPFITFEATVSEGAYIRSLAQIFLEKLELKGTLSYLCRLKEGKLFYENEKELNPLDYIDLEVNDYFGDKSWVENGKKISIDYLQKKHNGQYLIIFDDFFTIIEIINKDIKYLLNKVLL
ncbi:MAG: tRNA pseudouridine(55) synthase TruB [Campylobacterota bacterium]